MPEIIFDTCVLSNFALSGNLSLLKSIYLQTAYISDMVALENLRGLQKGHASLAAVKVAREFIQAGAVLAWENIFLKRPRIGITGRHAGLVLSRKARHDIVPDTAITLEILA